MQMNNIPNWYAYLEIFLIKVFGIEQLLFSPQGGHSRMSAEKIKPCRQFITPQSLWSRNLERQQSAACLASTVGSKQIYIALPNVQRRIPKVHGEYFNRPERVES